MVMYQNEAYSYTPYPGCAWTATGTIRFNKEYLAPTLRQMHPEVKLYLGTFNNESPRSCRNNSLPIRLYVIVFVVWDFNGKDVKYFLP